MTPDERQQALGSIAAEVRTCTRCRLSQTRIQAVPGEGHPDTEVMFVGEGPGSNEDQQGRPFVGAAGGLLTELLGTVGWKRDEVFITNVVKCRPPGNRDPEPDELAACRPYLERQLAVLDPALVVTLGRVSLQTFMPGARIGGAHGTMRPVDPATGARSAQAFAMYHPAAAFRQGSLRETLRRDMLSIPDALLQAREARGIATVGATAFPDDSATQPGPLPPVLTQDRVPVDAPEPEEVTIASAPDPLAWEPANDLVGSDEPPVSPPEPEAPGQLGLFS